VNDKQTVPFGSIDETRKDLGGEIFGLVDEEDTEMSDVIRQDRFHSQIIVDSGMYFTPSQKS